MPYFKNMKIYIRNMACESCKVVVRGALYKLKLTPVKVELGEAEVKETIGNEEKKKLNNLIISVGLQVVESRGGILIEKIKKQVHAYIDSEKAPKLNLSDYLSKALNYDYNYISNVFSEVEACTITHYLNSVKIERAKEMILFEDLTISEVAEKLHYSSVSHFSAHFKKNSGLPPSTFKKLKEKRRLTMQELAKK
jgi:YesN/AraC family two-component response regulator